VPGNPSGVACLGSYRHRFGKYGCSKRVRQRLGRQYIDRHAEYLQQLMPDCTDIEQRGFRRRVNEDIQRSLSSVSSPWATEPKIRGLQARCDITTRRMSSRWRCKATDGFMAFVSSLAESQPIDSESF
jgi:hypothetical protein